MLTLPMLKPSGMKIEKKSIFKAFLITASILILIVPDVLINDHQNTLGFWVLLMSKISLLIFFGLISLRLTRSYFLSYLIVGIPYLISSIIETINVIILDHFITADNIASLLNASTGEIKEFTAGFYIYFIVPITLVIAYFFILRKYRSINYNARNQKMIIPLAMIAVFISISCFELLRSKRIHLREKLVYPRFRDYYIRQHPFNLANETYVLAKIKLRAYRYKAQHDNFKFGILNPTDTVRPKLVIFIIGERMRYDNWSINGYERETSPNLEKIPGLISFGEHYSNSNFTYGSIPLIITQATPKNPSLAYSQKSIVSLFKEAGYETDWISNQYIFDSIDEKKVPDHLYELYRKDLYGEQHTDLDIIPVFDSIVNKKSKKNRLILINMLGAHGATPARFNVFKPNNSLENSPVTMRNAPIFINTYDNTVLFQDYVISELIRMTEKQNVSSVLLFTSDHGCNLFDSGRALFGYGSANPTVNETHIPMFISLSNKYIESNHDKYKNLLAHKNSLTTNNNLFYTLADLAHIKYKSFVKKQSIADSSFVEPSSRFVYVNGEVFEFKK
jgi:glucan phosphoethanolaminetransferase (alkaline phosphatase superfamily)